MKLTQEQINWINQERLEIDRIIKSEPRKGLIRWAARQEALELIIEMHNLAMAVEKKAKEERLARIEKGKENLNR